MIGRIQGILVSKQPPQLLVDVHGVGYEIEAPMSTFYQLPEVNQPVTLQTHLVVREDAQQLYGFASEQERRLFRSLIRVNGVGAKLALAILSGMSAGEFARCVHDNDSRSLVQLPGVGKKTAERLIMEMRDRLADWEDEELAATPPAGGMAPAAGSQEADREAVSALIALGYKPQEASRMVQSVDSEGRNSEDIIRAALKAAVSG
ncbi:Holliday junction branch migration protein RuvA [Thiohalophilus sp.]|uniref:Holliday junction branch migration protein RuvA n=1 Tax=Thiohalophilus sp. TaxID=3028392 RepID=UPI003974C0CF